MTTAAPVRERIAALDVLRGVAICGILFANPVEKLWRRLTYKSV
jgi:uncharacterized membrane protein YeiB